MPVTLNTPLMLAFPVILALVSVITIVALLLAVNVIFALEVMAMFEFPFCTKPVFTVVILPVVIIAVEVPKLPKLALPLAFNVPVILAPVLVITIVALLLEVNVIFALEVMVMFELPFWNVAPLIFDVTFILAPAKISPVILAVPAMLAPVLVTTITFACPLLEIVTFALAFTTTLLLPFTILVGVLALLTQLRTPLPSVESICPFAPSLTGNVNV